MFDAYVIYSDITLGMYDLKSCMPYNLFLGAFWQCFKYVIYFYEITVEINYEKCKCFLLSKWRS